MKKLKLKSNNYAGKLVVFEGVDGAGKTTLLNIASNYLTEQNIPHIRIKMPREFIKNHPIFDAYDNSPDDTIRNTVNLTHLTVFVSGDRLVTLSTQVVPALKQGLVVLCDRYCFTGYVRCTSSLIRKLSNQFVRPNLVIMPTASVQTLKQRVKQRDSEKNNYYNEQNVIEQIKKFDILAKKHKFIKIDSQQEKEHAKAQLFKHLDNIIDKNNDGSK